jgi:hypothetical protein
MPAISMVWPALLPITLTGAGCFAVVDVDRFHATVKQSTTTNPPAGDNQYLDLKFTLIGMKPHLTQLFEYRVIDDATNFVQSRGVVTPLGSADVVINMPLAVPKGNGPFHLDFYADVNASGGYDGIGSVITNDHAWRIMPLDNYPPGAVTPVDGLVQVTFTHNTTFTEIDTFPSGTPNKAKDTGLGATLHVTSAGAVFGDLMQVRIVDTGANHTRALMRVPAITLPSFNMTIPGVVEPLTDYVANVYIDANNNGTYDNPATNAGDLGWTIPGTADGTGLNINLDLQTARPSNIDVGAP